MTREIILTAFWWIFTIIIMFALPYLILDAMARTQAQREANCKVGNYCVIAGEEYLKISEVKP